MRSGTDIIARLMRYKLIYSMTGLVLGLICMLGGILLFFHGVAGSTSWTATILGNESSLTDAAPGVILFVVGLFVVIATHYGPKVDFESEKETENVTPRRRTGRGKTEGDGETKEIVRIKTKARAKALAKKPRKKPR